jgi:phosphoribosyl-dephospho-CoA transferase
MVTGSAGSAPHDLLQLQNVTGIDCAQLPGWAQDSLGWARWVVRRRAKPRTGGIPVGIRGRQRNQRHAWWIPVESVHRVVPPWELVDRLATYESTLAVVRTARAVRALMVEQGLRWGPTGSLGFTLASGRVAIRPESDLDVLIDTPTELPRERARELNHQLQRLGCAVDAQLATPAGGVSLDEWANTPAQHLLVRTESGPMLTANPWF